MTDLFMIKSYNGSLYGRNRQLTFGEVYTSVDLFLNDYNNLGLPQTITSANATTLYYLLYGEFANSTIASSDINRFKYRLFSLIFQHGGTWEKKLEIQRKLRSLSDEDILIGSRQIYNAAFNPSSAPGTETTDELPYINNQNVTHNRKGKLEGYSLWYDLLREDVTQNFLNKFKKLFKTFVEPEEPLIYITEE